MKTAKRRFAGFAVGLLAAVILALPTPALAYVQREEIVNSGHGSIAPQYLVVHETANAGASAANHVKLYSRGYSYAVHYVAELDGSTIYHTMRDDRKSWSVGRGNPYVVSIEMAHATNAQDFYEQYSQVAQWCANYLKGRGWGIDRLLSHNDCRLRWGGTDHTDPIGYFKTYGRSWSDFKALVSKYMANGNYQPSKVENVPVSTSTGVSTAKASTGFGGKYYCTVQTLNVRTSPTGAVVASYHKGQSVNLDDWYTTVNGYVWSRYTGASGFQRYVAVGKATGKVDASDYLVKNFGGSTSPVAPVSKTSTSWRTGRYTFRYSMQIRTGAGKGYRSVGTYPAGKSVNVYKTVSANGYVWGIYTGASGHTRYVALGSTSGARYAA